MATDIGSPQRFFHMPRFQHQAPRQVFYKRPDFAQQQAMQQLTFDGKRMRKAVNRKTIDYNPSVIRHLEVNTWGDATDSCWPLSHDTHSPFQQNHTPWLCFLLRTVCGNETIETSELSSLTLGVIMMWVPLPPSFVVNESIKNPTEMSSVRLKCVFSGTMVSVNVS